ncbi:MAG: DUF1080 domain-containing protein [Verrucomicrobiota bacterium]
MKSLPCFACLAFALLLAPIANADNPADDGFRPLFNGENFDGWYFKFNNASDPRADDAFTINDGMVHVFAGFPENYGTDENKNATHGMMYTNDNYSHYILRFEYRWLPTLVNNYQDWQYDSGCYYHITDDKIWPKGIEYQVRYNHLEDQNHTGDLILGGNALSWYTKDGETFEFPAQGGTLTKEGSWMRLGRLGTTSNDKDFGWNQCEVIVMGNGYAIHKLNGEIVNIARNLSVGEGKIGMQSETAEMQFRNIEIKEFAEPVPIETFVEL